MMCPAGPAPCRVPHLPCRAPGTPPAPAALACCQFHLGIYMATFTLTVDSLAPVETSFSGNGTCNSKTSRLPSLRTVRNGEASCEAAEQRFHRGSDAFTRVAFTGVATLSQG